jgi:hypothetical protein
MFIEPVFGSRRTGTGDSGSKFVFFMKAFSATEKTVCPPKRTSSTPNIKHHRLPSSAILNRQRIKIIEGREPNKRKNKDRTEQREWKKTRKKGKGKTKSSQKQENKKRVGKRTRPESRYLVDRRQCRWDRLEQRRRR